MQAFTVPEWALSHGSSASDAFELRFKGGTFDGKIAAKLAPHDHLLVTRYSLAPANSSSGVLPIDDDSVSNMHAAFVRHRKNGCVYCISLGSRHGTLINGARIPEHKPVKISAESQIQFGMYTQMFAASGATGGCAVETSMLQQSAADKENATPQQANAKKEPKQKQLQVQQPKQQQQQHHAFQSSSIRPFPFHTRFDRERLLGLLPPQCFRNASTARLLQLPKHVSLMLQAIPANILFCFVLPRDLGSDASVLEPSSGGRTVDVEQRAGPVALESRFF
jgi:hypothetical protein